MKPTVENGRGIVDASLYMVLATGDAEGRPWSTPVYFAHVGCREFFWVSSPEAAHSRNIAVRPEVGVAIFDSSVPIGSGQGVFMAAVAGLVEGEGVEQALEVFSRRSLRHGGRVWTVDDVRGDSGVRLYRAVAEEHSMLAKDGKPDHRVSIRLVEPSP
ncbi:pyridoxamine 5'-phosphate oxidase family protein [Streptomyces sp. DSM 40750]|uniref:pyridoxamine 5'-phosphate oxidase family protein n=1 Tax=Streptomyces sp. DSM 40750 TaxID=2801030 RepID=UPI00214BE1A6|nr:pyridoxamine 5'-phosphate oxidase family protein [Streptomyces sp. DSM 40750]UUU19336.1 pyridoxamine 5'-phosphate oxidase family protein [Streptomyces sp. DSM 40750]UUU27320.1 pyridoxamine 5'-phosphate oxidase family protein [Streptomyces sp. DSM 40750]